MKTNRFVFILCCLILSTSVYSQKNYSSGYIINLEGDTIKGLIDFRNWEISPEKIHFKENEADKAKKYSPKSINGFSTSGENYISAIVSVENSSRKEGRIVEDPELQITLDTVFLRSLIMGSKSILINKTWKGVENFYIRKGEEYELLEYKKYLKKINSETFINEVKNYIIQLKEYFADCESIQEEILGLKYTQSNFERLFKRYYNECGKDELLFKQEKKKLKVERGVLIGVTNTNLDLGTLINTYDFLVESDYSNSIDFTFGVRFDLLLPRNLRKLSFTNELLLTRFQIKGEYNNNISASYFIKTNSELKYTHLKLNTLAKYRYFIKSSHLYINAGLSNGFVLSEKNERIDMITIQSTESIETKDAIERTRSHEFGAIIGVGWQFKKFSLDVRYERGTGISHIIPLEAATDRTYLLFGYQF